MPFVQKLPEWNKPGTEPPISLKNAGWQATQKPPADYFNWLQYTAYMALKELQEKAQHKDDTVQIQDASITQKGITQLSNAVTSTLEDRAATPNAVKKVNDSLNAHTNDGSAHGIGDKSTLRTTQKSTIVGAINELFTNANDGKTAVASAVTAKGVAASPADTFATLAAKIGQINTGKKWASGTVTSSNESIDFQFINEGSYTERYLTVTGLNFRPNLIFMWITQPNTQSIHVVSLYTKTPIYTLSAGVQDQVFLMEISPTMSNPQNARGYKANTGNAYVNNTGFKLPVFESNKVYNWIAYE